MTDLAESWWSQAHDHPRDWFYARLADEAARIRALGVLFDPVATDRARHKKTRAQRRRAALDEEV